jgi:hypothetical protein
MLDEFGYTILDSFIFKSTWDLNYHYLTANNPSVATSLESKSTLIQDVGLRGIQTPIKNISL